MYQTREAVRLMKYIRKRQHHSQNALAGRMGIRRTYLAKIETGRLGLSIDILRKFCSAYGTSLTEFLIVLEALEVYEKGPSV